MQLLQLDPTTLLVDVNVRTETELGKDFLASVAEFGVLVPIVAVQTEQGVRVRYGHRRTLAAVQAGHATVPVYVTGEDDADDAARIVRQWAENEHRSGLSTSDKVSAIEQLSLLGLSPAKIAKQTRTRRQDVTDALTAAGSKLAKGAAQRWEFLTLDQAATVADFDSAPETVKVLVAAAKEGDGRFAHAAQRARDDRERQQARQAVVDQLSEAGVRVIDRPGYEDRTVRGLGELVDAEGTRLTAETHAGCPGHAAYIEQGWGEPRSVFVCTDWKARGHRSSDKAGTPQPLPEAERKARRQVITNNKAWMSAETVRRSWLRSFLSRKTPPKGAAPFVAAELAGGAHELRRAMERGSGELLTELFTVQDRAALIAMAAKATEGRAQVIALGFVLAAYEAATGKHTWRAADADMGRYFAFLAEQGYELSDVERLAVATPVKRRGGALRVIEGGQEA